MEMTKQMTQNNKEDSLVKMVNSILDAKYKHKIDEFNYEKLKSKVIEKLEQKNIQGPDVSIHIYDKNAKAQENIKFMNREPIFFRILHIDSKSFYFSYIKTDVSMFCLNNNIFCKICVLWCLFLCQSAHFFSV